MNRRDFLKLTGMGAMTILPERVWSVGTQGLIGRIIW